MTVFIPSSAADPLSAALWALSRPEQIRAAQDTSHLFPFRDALDGSRWLMVDTTFTIPVHADAVLDGIADILQPWIDAGHLPANTNAELAAFVENQRGQPLVVYDAFPQLFKLYDAVTNPTGLGKTLAQMISEGLLSAPTPPA